MADGGSSSGALGWLGLGFSRCDLCCFRDLLEYARKWKYQRWYNLRRWIAAQSDDSGGLAKYYNESIGSKWHNDNYEFIVDVPSRCTGEPKAS